MVQIIVAFCALCLLSGCGESKEQMLQQLELLEQANVSREPMENDSLAEALVTYFDSHGSRNERMRAKYILGRTYYCLGELPRALETYYEAADCADTTASDCDFAKLSRIHAQTAAIFHRQVQLRSEIEELKCAEYSAMKGKDTLMAIECYAQQSAAYRLLNNYDSVVVITDRASELFSYINRNDRSNQILGNEISSLIKLGRINRAKECIDRYLSLPGIRDKHGNLNKGLEIFYYSLGQYYLAINNVDSAECVFRKEIQKGEGLNNQIAGCKGLQEVFEQKKIPDSIAKYANLGYALNDSAYSLSEMENIQKMQAAYNYSHNKQVAEENRTKAEHLRGTVIALTSLIVLLMVSVGVWIWRYRERKEKELSAYKSDIQTLESLQSEIQALSYGNYLTPAEMIEQRQRSVVEVLGRIMKYKRKTKPSKELLENRLAGSPIVIHLKELTTMTPYQQASVEDIHLMRELINSEIPGFYSALNSPKYTLSEIEYNVSILIRLHFTPSEINKLTGISNSYISNMRSRLLTKVYGVEGSPKDYDQRVVSIS